MSSGGRFIISFDINNHKTDQKTKKNFRNSTILWRNRQIRHKLTRRTIFCTSWRIGCTKVVITFHTLFHQVVGSRTDDQYVVVWTSSRVILHAAEYFYNLVVFHIRIVFVRQCTICLQVRLCQVHRLNESSMILTLSGWFVLIFENGSTIRLVELRVTSVRKITNLYHRLANPGSQP